MARGIVITAKGQRLNMDELILKARRPMKSDTDRRDKVKPQRVPAKQMRVTGFMPSSQGLVMPHTESPPVIMAPEIAAAALEGPSMADYTGITIDDPKFLKEKPVDSMETANEALQEIMGGLSQYETTARKRGRKS